MARLLLYTDLSPSRPWLFATVHANRALLADHGIDLGPFRPWTCELIPSHTRFWNIAPEGTAPPDLIHALKTVQDQLDAGRDALLMSCVLHRPAHQALTGWLQEHLDRGRHEVRPVFVVGRPVCVLEQRYREMNGPIREDVGRLLVDRCGAVSLLLEDARREWGEANVALLTDLSESPAAAPCEDLAQRLFAALGCPPPRLPEHLPRHPLFLNSSEGRRLSRALEVRENAWPELDAGLFMDCLKATEREWETDPVSPLAFRQKLIREGAADLRALEDLLHLSSGDLDCPDRMDWLASRAEASPEFLYSQPLSGERVAAFAAALPPAVREPLRQRYANDALLLTPDQRALAAALDVPEAVAPPVSPEADRAGSAAIGEPVPPVELTVLTMTYNHEKYIAECMDSVLAQRTEFPVRHIVLDHHSTDETPAIVAAYAERHPSIRPVILSQRRLYENVMGLFLRCRTKYASLCDGDDYFTDPLKLQRQVDFLERRPHCGLCFHPVSVVHEGGGRPPHVYPPLALLPRGVREEYYLADLVQENMIQTNSVVYRWRFTDGLPQWFRPDLNPSDWYWHLLHAEKGKIGFLPEVMSVYRRHRQAVFYTATVSALEHRRKHGMAELLMYRVVNEHFQNRYFQRLGAMANTVFLNFLKLYEEEGNRTLLDQAERNFPEFARHFWHTLEIIRKRDPDRTFSG